jgi:hypothetical protein
VESRFKSDTEARVIEKRNTYEGFKAAALTGLNIDGKTGMAKK